MSPMGEVMVVREHARPCEHGSLWAHWLAPTKARWWHRPDCPGGHEVVLRRHQDGHWVEDPGSSQE